MDRKLKIFLTYIFCLVIGFGFAQKDSLEVPYDTAMKERRKFDTEKIEKYRADKDFNYTEKEQKTGFFAKVFDWFKRILQRFFTWLFGVERATGILEAFLRMLPYLLLVTVLYFLLKFFLKIDAKSLQSTKNKSVEISLSDEEQLIKNEDLNLLISKAISSNNFRLAIRYYYLLVLKKLASKDHIDWQQDKTNEDYLKELTQSDLKSSFQRSTLLYDFIWYGNFNIDAVEFSRVQAEFEQFKNQI